ncbi:MAG: holo-ACP synthase, partial [Betaproteobacteria bacterium]|nr:holo-ACP synthase [Betaproteobacteria bacterium]
MSTFGIGLDRVLIHRIAAAYDRWGQRFAQRVLGPQELEVFWQ